ncbi:hypothetical protein ACHHYP_10897 [Achlya hypogyna]|uniref:Uncharacterized protein n=1 Tax=Achlya hypogyna TaxID=1202772 RepID=A0A1V9ZHP4_ACHHY|nr:hypothetical protein ACHHYP_10897 [Achlya hypogyna]
MHVNYPILGLGQAKSLVAICGGGGSARTGVHNTVDVYATGGDVDYTLLGSANTGTELASGLAISPDGRLLAVSINAGCWLYSIAYDPLDTQKKFALEFLVKFQTDFAAAESGQSSVVFVGNKTLLTGGEDSTVRTWAVATDVATKGYVTSPALGGAPDMTPVVGDIAVGDHTHVMLVSEFTQHTKRIKQIHVDPFSRHLVVSSDEAAACHLWWLHEAHAVACSLSQADALAACFAAFPKSVPPTPKGFKSPPPPKHQFRCVRFAPNGQFLMTVLSPPRGDAFLVKWVPATTSQVEATGWQWTIAAIAVAGNEPVGSCCISDDGALVATATASGDVQTFRTIDLAKVVRRPLPDEHTFAVTGMAFLPQPCGHYCLATAGADKRLLVHTVEATQVPKGISLRAVLVGAARLGVASVFAAVVGAIVFGLVLVFLHAAYPDTVLLASPFTGIDDIAAYELQTADATATLAATAGAVAAAVLSVWFCMRTSVVHGFFLDGLALCGLSVLSLYVAVVPDMALRWSLAPLVLSRDLIEYKLSIVSGIGCVILLILHSFLVVVLRA